MPARPSLPGPYPFRRRRRWWRKFASPRWVMIAAPVLALPVLAMVLFDQPPGPSDIEQAVGALPIAGAAGGHGRFAPLGAEAREVPTTTSASIYANSAVAAAVVMHQRDDNPADRAAMPFDFITATYAALHPARRAREDLLVGQYALLRMPLMPDLSLSLLFQYCSSGPDDPGYGTPLDRLPINPNVVAALTSFIPAGDMARYCPRL